MADAGQEGVGWEAERGDQRAAGASGCHCRDLQHALNKGQNGVGVGEGGHVESIWIDGGGAVRKGIWISRMAEEYNLVCIRISYNWEKIHKTDR